MSEIVIQATDLHKSFGTGETRLSILKGLSFAVTAGEFVSVMGPSGCGKSTLLYLLGGLDDPDSGKIVICGKNLARLNDKKKSVLRRQDIGFIFQFYNLVPNLTVEENVMLPVVMDGRKAEEYRSACDEILNLVGLTEKAKAYPAELSGGQQQRVAIARALIMQPRVILADEPTGNLDRKSGTDVMEIFRNINRSRNITILQVTHSDEMAAYGDRVIRLEDGLIVQDAPCPHK